MLLVIDNIWRCLLLQYLKFLTSTQIGNLLDSTDPKIKNINIKKEKWWFTSLLDGFMEKVIIKNDET